MKRILTEEEKKNPWHNIPTTDPTIKKREGKMCWENEVEEKHPAFGMISFSRTQGGHPNLFGSGITHNEKIRMTLHTAKKFRSKYSENYMDQERIIEVELSPNQFAEAITSLNYGSGVPCTIRSMRQGENEQYLPLPYFNLAGRKAEIQQDLKDKMGEFSERVAEDKEKISKIINKDGAINKGDRKALAGYFNQMMQEIKSNIPFLQKCMQEGFDDMTVEAKTEVEAYLNRAVGILGERALSNPENQIEAIKGIKMIGEDNE